MNTLIAQAFADLVGIRCSALLADLVHAYEREVNPASDWRETALTEDEFELATREYRAAKQWLSANDQAHLKAPNAHAQAAPIYECAPCKGTGKAAPDARCLLCNGRGYVEPNGQSAGSAAQTSTNSQDAKS